jgi:hypothetical protein
MAATDPLNVFVRDGLTAGHTRADLQDALDQARWTKGDVAKALAKYAETPFSPPAPRPTHALTARHSFFYAALFTALAFTAANLVHLLYALIDLQVSDALQRSSAANTATRSIRWAVAMLLVAGPIFVLLTRAVSRGDAGMRTSALRKWATYLALFVSGLFFTGDGVVTIYTLLDGGMTLKFALKAAVLAAVSGAVFGWHLFDAGAASDEG